MGNCCSAADEYTLLDDGRTGRHQYGTTRHGGGHRDSEAEGGLAQIFWDVENCGIPSGINPAVVVQKLRALRTSRGYAPSGIVATVASNHLSLATREALVASGVDVLDSTSTKPSAADFLLLEEIQKWTFHHPPNCYGVILITGDKDFARRLSFLNDAGYDVLLIHGPLISETMKAIVVQRLLWQDVCGVSRTVGPAHGARVKTALAASEQQPTSMLSSASTVAGIRRQSRTRPRHTSLPPACPPLVSDTTAVHPSDIEVSILGSPGGRPAVEHGRSESAELDEEGVRNTGLAASHYALLPRLERPNRSLDFWSAFGLLYWIYHACFHLSAGRQVPPHTYGCIIGLAKRGLICASAPLEANPPTQATYLFLTSSGLGLWRCLTKLNWKTGGRTNVRAFRHAVYFWMEWALINPDSNGCRSSVLGGMLKPVLTAGMVKRSDGAFYSSVTGYLQEAITKKIFLIVPGSDMVDPFVTLNGGFMSLWIDVKMLCSNSAPSRTLEPAASNLGNVVCRRIMEAIPPVVLPIAPLLIIVDPHSKLKGSLDLYHIVHMMGYGSREALLREATAAGWITSDARNYLHLTPKGLQLVRTFKAAKSGRSSS